MNHSKFLTSTVFFVLILLLLAGCSTNTSKSKSSSLPVTTSPTCGTIITQIKDDSLEQFGQTEIEIEFTNFYFDGIVAGNGFVKPVNGSVEVVKIGNKSVTLTRNDFGDGYIYSKEFGQLKVLFSSNIMQGCPYIVATPEQLTQITDWLK